MTSIRQATLNLLAVGLYHVLEQQLTDLCWDGAFDVPEPKDPKLAIVEKWYAQYFDLNLSKFPEWDKIDELRRVANTVKHGKEDSEKELRRLRPELLDDPIVYPRIRAIFPNTHPPVRLPLAGDGLYVTEAMLHEYCATVETFVSRICSHFDDHASDYYPRGCQHLTVKP